MEPMTWIALGTAAVSAAQAIFSSSESSKYASQQAELQMKQIQLQQEQMDFARQQYTDWEETFGSIGDNLSNYYKNLTPERYAAMGNEQLDIQMQQVTTQLNNTLASMGIQNSGAALQMKQNLQWDLAKEKAKNNVQAVDTVNQQKQNWYQLGQQNLSAAQNMITSANTGMSNIYKANADYAGQLQQNAYKDMNSGIGGAASSLMQAGMSHWYSNSTNGNNSTNKKVDGTGA